MAERVTLRIEGEIPADVVRDYLPTPAGYMDAALTYLESVVHFGDRDGWFDNADMAVLVGDKRAVFTDADVRRESANCV